MFYKISPSLAKDLAAGAFLTPPADGTPGYKITESKDPSSPRRVWRETFAIRNATVKEVNDQEVFEINLIVPADVVSPGGNQGRSTRKSLWFPWKARDDGDEAAQKQVSMSYRALIDILKAVGAPTEFTSLDALPLTQMSNMRVSAQVRHEPDKNGVPRENIEYFRAPK